MSISSIIFDLDGTLVDSAPGIIASYEVTLRNAKIEPATPVTKSIIGPPLKEILAKLAGSESSEKLELLSAAFRDHYDTHGFRMTSLFDGVRSLLERLNARAIPIFIATNKRSVPTRGILDYLDIRRHFVEAYSLDSLQPPLSTKAELIRHIFSVQELIQSECLYIGDREEDRAAALKAGVQFALAEWGYAEITPQSSEMTSQEGVERLWNNIQRQLFQ